MNRFTRLSSTGQLTWLAVLLALQLIFNRIKIGPTNVFQVGLGFIVTAIIGYYYGPAKSMLTGLASDVLGHILFPAPGGFFWGFTLSAILAGLIYGSLLYRQTITWWRLLLATSLVVILIQLGLNTTWVSILSHLDWWPLFWVRSVKELISIPIQTGVLILIFHWLKLHNYSN
ncbi:folate family ECF transporter S component [Lactobacillus sp. DCY120]|uniref:Folate family ECF transporter S component n=1 Tax=Bombilactobacillus apium TaxID=2675299 RepID=A0A850R530_9LACO|nr:folate family ECF transporter S component [Bombilactobacillus apium]NVY95957.1 folate family ECF transporter S component [Bombilactobacillus apium]